MSEEPESPAERGGLIERLLRRHVIQTAAIYVDVAWAADPSPRNFANNLIVGLAVHADDFDFAFEVLNSLVRDHQIAGFDLGHSGFWDPKPANKEFRADPRFAELMERIGIADYWREFGWSDHCRPQGDSFSCS